MAFSDNIIKNMANEIVRNCQAQGVTAEYEFTVYVIQLMLYNPRFGSADAIDRTHLDKFVNECVRILVSSDPPIHTLKMQYTVDANYSTLSKLVDKHLESIEQCLRPLIDEILDAYPETEEVFMKLYRKISIFVVLSSGLGNPGAVITLKEGMAALESVFPVTDLRVFVSLPRPERLAQLRELVTLVSGVRLFNRDCGRGGEGIPDLTFNTLDAGAACRAALTSTLTGVTQRVSWLTAAAADAVTVDAETGDVLVTGSGGLTREMSEHYKCVFDLITFYRQYEAVLRILASDTAAIADTSAQSVERTREVLQEIHAAVRYKTAVPAATVYPLFKKLWSVWRTMQNMMYLLATIHRLMQHLSGIQEHVKIPSEVEVLRGKQDVAATDGCLASLKFTESDAAGEKSIQFQGFCAMCLVIGALVPRSAGAGLVEADGRRYGFCSAHMAKRFSLDSRRYINEVLEYSRSNVHLVNLLHLQDELARVRDIRDLVTRVEPKIQVIDRDTQTDTHPQATHIDRDYSWDMWQWKRRACQWANIVKCRTHATQTLLSHMRSEVPCQTAEPRERGVQTNADAAVNTDNCGAVTALRMSGAGPGKVAVQPSKICPCTVGMAGDIDDKTYEIIKELNEKSK